MNKLDTTEVAIVAAAITMLSKWSWSRDGEPISVLTAASKLLFGAEMHEEITNISRAERVYAPTGALWNNVEVRLSALRAVLRFCCGCGEGTS